VVRRRLAALLLVAGLVQVTAPLAMAGTLAVTTFAGTGVAGDAGDGGEPTAARLRAPAGVAAVKSGAAVFIADSGNHRVRRVQDGVITTVAGTGTAGYGGDGGSAAAAVLNTPVGLALRPSGVLLIADTGNHAVRQVEFGVVTSVAGGGGAGYDGDGGPAASAHLRSPRGVAVRPSGEMYVADSGNNAIRLVDTQGRITTVAGTGLPGYTGDHGDASGARLRQPAGVAVTTSGVVYVADTGNHVIRRIGMDGVISSVAGTGRPGYDGDGGPATAAALREPSGVDIDAAGRVVIADSGNHVLRRVEADGSITTIAGTGVPGDGGDGGAADSTPLRDPVGVAPIAGGMLIAEAGTNRIRLLVDPTPPPAPVLATTEPASPANHNQPRLFGEAPPGTTVRIFTDPWCTSQVAAGSAEALASTGIEVGVADDRVTSFYALAVNAAGTGSSCAGPLDYTEDSTAPPAPTIRSEPDPGDRTPTWHFAGEPGTALQCQLSADTVLQPYGLCEESYTHNLSTRLAGSYTFKVRATDAAGNVGAAAVSVHALPAGFSVPPVAPPQLPTPGEPTAPDPTAPDPTSPAPGIPGPTVPGPTVPGPTLPGPPGGIPDPPAVPVPEPWGDTPIEDPSGAGVGIGGPETAPTDAPLAPQPSPTSDTRRLPGPRSESDVAASGPVGDAGGGSGSKPAGGWFSAAGVSAAAAEAGAVLAAVVREPAFPTSLIFLVAAFLAVQHHIDRKDPKLAMAPVVDVELEFVQLPRVHSRPMPR